MSGDDLPFAIGSEGELQVPCSNLSVGVLPEEHRRDVFELWSDSIRNQVSDKGVAIIYDHPLGRMETLEDEIVRFLQDQLGSGLNPITMAEYGSLWRTRPQIRHVSRTANEISYELEGDESVFLVLIMPPPDIETLDVGRSLVMSSTGGFDYFRDDDRSKALSEVSRRSFLRSLVRDIAKISVHAVRPLKRRHLVHSDGLGTGRMPD